MNWLYLLLDLLAVAGPVVLSFDSRVQYVYKWKFVLLASTIISVPFIIHDELFTSNGFWGFNDAYITGVKIGNLPIEEILFFLVIPFSCAFIYACCNYYFRRIKSKGINQLVQLLLFSYILMILFANPTGWYSMTVSMAALIILFIWVRSKNTGHIGLAFLISLIPFFIMNGILTGAVTESPVVWYDDIQNTTWRIGTIPFEDTIYAFVLIVSTVLLSDNFISQQSKELKESI